jgi:hypothetical protein
VDIRISNEAVDVDNIFVLIFICPNMLVPKTHRPIEQSVANFIFAQFVIDASNPGPVPTQSNPPMRNYGGWFSQGTQSQADVFEWQIAPPDVQSNALLMRQRVVPAVILNGSVDKFPARNEVINSGLLDLNHSPARSWQL